jgi:ribosomal protein S6
MRYYELSYLISPDLSETEAKDFAQRVLEVVQGEGGILGKTQDPQRKMLCYKIKKKDFAYLSSLDFYLDPGKMESLEKKLKAKGEILRYLIFQKPVEKIKVPKIPEIKKVEKPKEKVELEEIEKKLEEILGQ